MAGPHAGKSKTRVHVKGNKNVAHDTKTRVNKASTYLTFATESVGDDLPHEGWPTQVRAVRGRISNKAQVKSDHNRKDRKKNLSLPK